MSTALWVYAAITVATILFTTFISAPYGRHEREGWGPVLPAKVGWVAMELPSVLVAIGAFVVGAQADQLVPRLLLGVWLLHYLQRTLIFPFLMRGKAKKMPLVLAAVAFAYTSFNAWINLHHVGDVGHYPTEWLSDPRFLGGLALFLVGYYVNLRSDHILRTLRAPGESGYKIPHGFLYRWVSSPNYLGEMMEWFGWALMTWSLPGLFFALYTVANLGPRAMTNHRWYQETFPDYPTERKALIPGVL